MNVRLATVMLVPWVILASISAAQADLALDAGFASDGLAEIDVDSNLDSARDIAVQTDGKYVLAGMSRQVAGDGTLDYAVVTRLNDDGTIDADFADGGTFAALPGGSAQSFGGGDARAVVIQPTDQRIVVVGNWNPNDGSGYRVFALRLLPDGTPDADFGTTGATIVAIPGFLISAQAADVALQSDGSILISGGLQLAFADPAGFVLRLTASGALDTSFGNGGLFTSADPTNPGAAMFFNAMEVVDADAVVTAGGIFDIVLAKLSSDGQPDSAFAGDGIATFNVASGEISGVPVQSVDAANGIAVQSNGKILVTGSTQPDVTVFQNAIMVARVTATGGLDTSFGTSGYAFLPHQAGQETGYDVVVRSGDDMIVAGVGFKPVQVSPNGKAFSVLADAFPPQSINGLAVLDDGRVVGGGEQNIAGADYEMVAMRLAVSELADPGCEGPGGGLLCGDLTDDCAIKAGDALVALKMAVGSTPPDPKADVDGNGHVTASDALSILRVAVGISQPSSACNG